MGNRRISFRYFTWFKKIIKTTDGGITWSLIRSDTLFSYVTNSRMRFNSFTTGYMFNRSLVKSTNSGLSWNQTDSIATTGKSDYFFINSDTGWCIGSGGSVIRTNNGGTNWTSQNSFVTNSLYSICFVNENIGYIAGSNGLILKTITGGLTSVNQTSSAVPASFLLEQNFPNPFNPETFIRYSLSENAFVSLKVFDVLGKEIATLVNEKQNQGSYNYQFSTNNYQLSSGIYFYSLFSEGTLIGTKRMILLK